VKGKCERGAAPCKILGLLMATFAVASMPRERAWAADERPVSRAVILVGLPGDEEHERLFAEALGDWRAWLTGPLGLDPAHVLIFAPSPSRPATHANIEKELGQWKRSLKPADRLWVFLLGHANDDGEHAWFHLAGPDLRDDQLAKLFEGIPCREQVFWLTTPEAGRFLHALSVKGRIVVAASQKGEDNETEFPHALCAVMKRPPAELDTDKDGKVSVLELYAAVVAEVQARYEADKRMTTEHAQLDDNGDGIGTQQPVRPTKGKSDAGISVEAKHRTANRQPPPDGALAARTSVSYKEIQPADQRREGLPSQPAEKSHGKTN
jgi:hypothetical protein